MAMKRTLFCLTCVVADHSLECFVNVKAGISMIQFNNLSFGIWKFNGDEKDEHVYLFFF